MGAVHLPDAIERAIEREVAAGRAVSNAAFLEEAVLRLIEDARLEDEDVQAAAAAGIADIEAGRYTTVATSEDGERVQEDMVVRMRASLAGED